MLFKYFAELKTNEKGFVTLNRKGNKKVIFENIVLQMRNKMLDMGTCGKPPCQRFFEKLASYSYKVTIESFCSNATIIKFWDDITMLVMIKMSLTSSQTLNHN